MRRHLGALANAVLSVACSSAPASAPLATSTALGGDVARVADVPIPPSLVQSVAEARHMTARESLYALIDDALLAAAVAHSVTAWPSTAARARSIVDRAMSDARAAGRATDAELSDVAVIHAVVLRTGTIPDATAIGVARSLLSAVRTARTDSEFETAARAVTYPHAQLRIERIPAFDARGRTADGDEMDATFVAAAFGLRAPGDMTGIVETAFGWHVIRLLERGRPAADVLELRRTELESAVFALRARSRLNDVVDRRKASEHVEFSPAVDQLMAEAAEGPH